MTKSYVTLPFLHLDEIVDCFVKHSISDALEDSRCEQFTYYFALSLLHLDDIVDCFVEHSISDCLEDFCILCSECI